MLGVVVCCRRVGDAKPNENPKEETTKLIEDESKFTTPQMVKPSPLEKANSNEESEEESSSEQDEDDKEKLA